MSIESPVVAIDQAGQSSGLPLPAYSELRDWVNTHQGAVTEFWARTQFCVTDKEGKQLWENGEGTFIFRRPNQIAINASYLGKAYWWMGCDSDRVWVFESIPSGSVVRVARNRNLRDPNCDQPDLLLDSDSLVDLAGLGRLPDLNPLSAVTAVDIRDASGKVRSTLAFFVARDNYPLKIYQERATMQTTRIELWNADRSQLIASTDFSEYATVTLNGTEKLSVKLPHRLRLSSPQFPGEISVKLSEFAAVTVLGPISHTSFDFESIDRLMLPAIFEVLDRRCAMPAIPEDRVLRTMQERAKPDPSPPISQPPDK